jgi:uncharacterized LabA/DUF88 family protein
VRQTEDAIFSAVKVFANIYIFLRKKIPMERVSVYIDGFNLYFGMMEAGYGNCRWLDVEKLSKNILKPGQVLIDVKYFTSSVNNNPDKQKRQIIYLEAIETTSVKIIYGHYQLNKAECKRCGNIWPSPSEKMTDVNIATNLIVDAYKDTYDTAILISGDSDLVPPIRVIHENFPKKRVCVAFPPKRHNFSVTAVAKGNFMLGRKKLVDSQFPVQVKNKVGYILNKPKDWY